METLKVSYTERSWYLPVLWKYLVEKLLIWLQVSDVPSQQVSQRKRRYWWSEIKIFPN